VRLRAARAPAVLPLLPARATQTLIAP
jgi:hypothetical protein